MQYRNIENAENILQKMVGTNNSIKCLNSVSEHNGVKCACDGHRAAVILPEGVPDWDLSDAYFLDDDNKPTLLINRAFKERTNDSINFQISKKKAEDLFNCFKDLKEDSNRELVCVNINTMTAIKETMSDERERIMGFNKKYLKEALDFILCSDDETIEIYYDGIYKGLIMKSARLYVVVLPVRVGN